MSKSKATNNVNPEMPIEGMLLECVKDKYKLSYAAIRWAKEIKMKENLPEAIPLLVPRALREILTGKVSYKEIEKLSVVIKVAPPPQPTTPTIKLNVDESDADLEKPTKSKKEKD
jgi:DNA-directed RNA polymerase subunit K/omega